MVLSVGAALATIFSACGVGLLFGLYNVYWINKINLDEYEESSSTTTLRHERIPPEKIARMKEISGYIADGATTFLYQEYKYLGIFVVLFAILLFFTVENNLGDFWTTFAFLAGAATSVAAGFIGMKIAVMANVRTTFKANESIGAAFVVAYRAGTVLGFILVSLGLLNLTLIIVAYVGLYLPPNPPITEYRSMFENIAGYGLGGSTIALFGRVGGGIYTKAADVGADLVGKVVKDLDEDSPRNPGVIADNVGDNVGDIAGMGSDLFGSLAESTCAALVVSGTSVELTSFGCFYYPLMISASGIFMAIICSFFATNIMPITEPAHVERSLNGQLVISTLLMTPILLLLGAVCLPDTFKIQGFGTGSIDKWYTCICTIAGLWSGLIIGYVTEFFTSNAHKPVQEIADACVTGAATNIIYGLALGFLSNIVPIIAIGITICLAFVFAGMYGIALSALGMLSTLCIALTIDAYGPISDNAGGIAEICEVEGVREKTDVLDAAGNTTAAVGKGFAIGSACLVALALYGAFVTRSNVTFNPNAILSVNILTPNTFAFLIIGAMLPYAFAAMTMKAVGTAAKEMIFEIKGQMDANPGILNGTVQPDYNKCIAISTAASIKQMIAPGLLVMVSPFVVGVFFGTDGIVGLLPGAIVSGVQVAISFSNAGGAWDNAKKYIECGNLVVNGEVRGKKTDEHKAAVIGDTVGDPLKDTSGPSLNILIKLMSILSLVFCPFFLKTGFLMPYLEIDGHSSTQ